MGKYYIRWNEMGHDGTKASKKGLWRYGVTSSPDQRMKSRVAACSKSGSMLEVLNNQQARWSLIAPIPCARYFFKKAKKDPSTCPTEVHIGGVFTRFFRPPQQQAHKGRVDQCPHVKLKPCEVEADPGP